MRLLEATRDICRDAPVTYQKWTTFNHNNHTGPKRELLPLLG